MRWRTGRLEDLGFPSWDASMRIYGFLRPDRLRGSRRGRFSASTSRAGSLPVWISELPGVRSDERALFRATRELTPQERGAQHCSTRWSALANRIAVADRMDLGDAGVASRRHRQGNPICE